MEAFNFPSSSWGKREIIILLSAVSMIYLGGTVESFMEFNDASIRLCKNEGPFLAERY